LGKWFDVLLHLLDRRTLPTFVALENPEPLQVLSDATLKTATPPQIACLNIPISPQPPNHYHSLGSTLCVRNSYLSCCLGLVSRQSCNAVLQKTYTRMSILQPCMHAGPTDTDPPPITEWRWHQWGSTDFYLIVPLGCHQHDGSG
jgi:hypothetical protein